MKCSRALVVLLLALVLPAAIAPATRLLAQTPAPPPPMLRGAVTDPSGAVVPDALVQLRGPGGEHRARTDAAGRYSFASLRPGKYLVRVIAKGFTVTEKRDFEISAALTLNVQAHH